MAEDTQDKGAAKNGGPGALIYEGCAAYGINKKFLLASAIDALTGEAVLVTVGGAKVRFKAGQKVEPLNQIRITGINPNPKRRQLTGAKK